MPRHKSYFDGPQTGAARTHIPTRQEMEVSLQEGRCLARRIVDAYEKREQSIARQIHCHTQQLVGVLLYLHAYERSEEDSDACAAAFATAKKALGEVIDDAWQLVSQLRLSFVDESGIVSGITHLVSEMRGAASGKIEFVHSEGLSHLSVQSERTVFRIVEELFTNACRHSQSAKTRVELSQDEERLRIEVRDWGVGFDPESVSKRSSGLNRVRDWAAVFGGSMSIDSAPGKGTRVVVELPLPDNTTP